MKHFQSEHSFPKRNSELILPKIVSSESTTLYSARNSLATLQKSKRSLILLKEIKPAKQIQQSDLSSDTSMLARQLATPEKKKKVQPELAVLSLNKNKRQRPKNRFVKEVFVGEEAVQKFYDRYKHIDRYKEKEDFMNENNPVTQIVQLLENHGFAPRKLDLIKLKGSHAILDLRKLGLGQGSMGNVVSDIMNLLGNFEYVDLSSNQIDRLLSETLVSELGKVKIINLSSNRIGKVGCDKFSQLFLHPKTKIQELYLNDNNLMDNAGCALISNLAQYGDLRVLNLNKNFMGNKFALELKEYLQKDQNLEQLYLGWNQFGDKAGRSIFEGIEKHSELKVFDYSWNVVGIFSVDALAQVFRENDNLLHVDFSFCEIDKKCSQKLAKALDSNQTIYGFHFQGNSGYIDHKGYLKLTEKEHHQYPLPIVRGVIRNINSIHPNTVVNQYTNNKFRDICWICQSWQEIYVKVKKDDPEIQECYIHIQSQNYKAVKLENGDGYFETYRMLSLEDHQFFFTFTKGPGKRTHFVSNDYPIVTHQKQLTFNIGDTTIITSIPQLNRVRMDFTQDVIDENYFPNVHCVPRSQEVRVIFRQKQQANFKQVKKVIVKKKRKVIREDKLKIKFRELDQLGGDDFLKDKNDRDGDEDYLKRCLEFDIANSKILKLIKREEDLLEFKSMMTGYYRDFKDAFYYLANNYPAMTGVYSISELPFEKFLEQQKYVTKRVTHAKVMLKMISCLSVYEESSPDKRESPNKKSSPEKKGNENMKLFVRPQFLEFLIRLALEKWCTAPPKPKKKKPEEEKKEEEKKDEDDEDESPKKQKIKLPLPLMEGLEKTMKSLSKYASRVKAANWRKQKYLVIDIYTVIKGYEPFLLELFDRYSSGRKRLDKAKKLKGLMTLEEIKEIFLDTEIKRTKEAIKDLQVPFLDSKRLEVEDGNIQFGLNFDEFCECLARYSEILWFAPIASEKDELWDFEANRRSLPLFIRFQSLIVNIYRRKLDLQNRKMNRIAEKGLFEQETEMLLERVKDLDLGNRTDLAFKMNSLDPDDEITLKGLIQDLKDKYENMVVQREEQIEEEQEQQVIDD